MTVGSVAEKGSGLADLFAAPARVGKLKVAAVEIRLPQPPLDVTPPSPRIDALMVRLQLGDYRGQRYWEDGVAAPSRDIAAGEVLFHDLRRGPRLVLDQPYHALHVHIPRAAFDAVAADANAVPIDDFDYAPGVGIDDPTIAGLGASILAGLRAGLAQIQPFVGMSCASRANCVAASSKSPLK